jgi:hypothetical protein
MPEARIAIHNLHSRTGPAKQLAESGASVLLLCETRPLLVQAALRRRLGQGWEHRTRDAMGVWWDSTVWAPYRLRFLPLGYSGPGDTSSHAALLVWLVHRATSQPVCMASVHLPPHNLFARYRRTRRRGWLDIPEKVRAEKAAELLAALPTDVPVVAAGDFNTELAPSYFPGFVSVRDLVAIKDTRDHALARGASWVSASTTGTVSDHPLIVATARIPSA